MKKNTINVAGLKKTLPQGAVKEIAIRSKVSRYTVYNVLKGGSCNTVVLLNIKNYLEEVNTLVDQINSMVPQKEIA